MKLRVKKLDKKGGSRTHKLKRLYKVGRSARIVSSDEASLGDQEDASKQGRKIHDIDADEDITLENVHDDDIMFDVSDLAGEEVFFAEQGVPDNKKDDAAQVNTAVVSTASTILVSAAIITEDEITLAQLWQKLKSVLRFKTRGKGILVEEHVKSIKKKDQIRLDEELAFKLQAEEEQEERLAREKVEANVALTEEEMTFKAKIENMAGWKPKDLKSRSFVNIQELFDKAFKRVNTFVVLQNRQKVDDDQEAAKMKELIKIILDEEEVVVDAIPLATKPPSIIDWKIMLRSFDREDLETLWKLVKAKHGYTRPEEGYERVLWCDLKTMFEHHVEDVVWRNQRENKVLVWKLFDSCGVHFVRFQNLHVFMLVEKRYPLTPVIIIDMLYKKLQDDH
ncbi:hypothetical protein Tco_0155279 [Tanacetum coccineum]